jgi:hypothetical protein
MRTTQNALSDSDKRIESEGYEWDGGERSYWIYLVPGYIWQGEVHFIHEETKRDARLQMIDVTECHADAECQAAWEKAPSRERGFGSVELGDCSDRLRYVLDTLAAREE